jgi:hypothetical protein
VELELADVIRSLREELQLAIAAGEDEALRFELGPVELDVSVAITAAGQAGAKARFWVVEAGAEARTDRTSTQRITLTLTPKLADGDRTPMVSGPRGAVER